jgi:ribosomal protein L10
VSESPTFVREELNLTNTLNREYASIFIVGVDNVSSQQMHEIRHALRGEGVVLMGKNTMVWESAIFEARKLISIGPSRHQGISGR